MAKHAAADCGDNRSVTRYNKVREEVDGLLMVYVFTRQASYLLHAWVESLACWVA